MTLNPGTSREVEERLLRFEDGWRSGSVPQIDAFLDVPEEARSGLLLELAMMDLEYRVKSGQPRTARDYLDAYLELRSNPGSAVALIRFDFDLKSRSDPALGEDRFLAAYPEPEYQAGLRREFGLPEIPGFQIEATLGRGGMGVVYRARQPALNRLVAIKLLSTVVPDEARVLEAEARATARVSHPNIVQVHEIGRWQDRPYLVLEFIAGGTLEQRLAVSPLLPNAAADFVRAIARGLQHAHEGGVIHRDIKPANILLAGGTLPKLSDFGLARQPDARSRVTRTGVIAGTPSYMSPEQARGEGTRIGVASDIYSLGAVLFACLTGRPPFEGPIAVDVLRQVVADEPVPVRRLQPGVTRDLETICLHCLNKDPRHRYATAAELADDLDRFLAGRPIQARPASAVERLVKWSRRRPAIAALLGLLVMVLGAAGVGAVLYESQLRNARNRALGLAEERRVANDAALQAADSFVDELAAGLLPIGGTQSPVLDQILTRAADIYEQLDRKAPSPAVDAGRAKMLNAQAEVYAAGNRFGQALQAAQNALILWEKLLTSDLDPKLRNQVKAGKARTLATLGDLHQVRGSLPRSGASFAEALVLYKALATEEPGRLDWLDAEAGAHAGLANILFSQAEFKLALDHRQQALALREKVYQSPDATLAQKRSFAASRELLADQDYYDPARRTESRDGYKQALALYGELLRNAPWDTQTREAFTRASTSLGELYRELFPDEKFNAEAYLNQGLKNAEFLVELGPTNIRWLRERERARLDLNLLQTTKNSEIEPKRILLKSYQDATDLTSKKLAEDPETLLWQNSLAEGYCLASDGGRQLAQKLVLISDPTWRAVWDRAIADGRNALELRKPLLERDPTNYDWAQSYLRVLECLADLLSVRSPDDARAYAEEGLRISREWHEKKHLPGEPYMSREFETVLARLKGATGPKLP